MALRYMVSSAWLGGVKLTPESVVNINRSVHSNYIVQCACVTFIIGFLGVLTCHVNNISIVTVLVVGSPNPKLTTNTAYYRPLRFEQTAHTEGTQGAHSTTYQWEVRA